MCWYTEQFNYLLSKADVLSAEEIEELAKDVEKNKDKIAKSFLLTIPKIVNKFRIQDPLVFEEAMSQAFFGLSKALNAYKPGKGSIRALIYRTVENEIKLVLRRSNNNKHLNQNLKVSLDEPINEQGTVKDLIAETDGIEKELKIRAVKTYIANIKDTVEKNILVLFYHGVTQKEIARSFGLTAKKVRAVLDKHFEKMREIL